MRLTTTVRLADVLRKAVPNSTLGRGKRINERKKYSKKCVFKVTKNYKNLTNKKVFKKNHKPAST